MLRASAVSPGRKNKVHRRDAEQAEISQRLLPTNSQDDQIVQASSRMVSAALASILRSERSDFNARFIAARRLYPDLQPEAFTEFLETAVDDLVQAVAAVAADRVGEVTSAAYDAALELVGQKLAGPGANLGSRLRLVEEGWRRVLPLIAPLVATAPGRVIPAVCNAIHQLAATPAARPKEWIEITEKLGPQCADAEMFLKLGQVAAWRAGFAHFRQGAIAAGDALPGSLVLAALGARSDLTWADVRAQLLANPWFDPAGARNESAAIRVVAQVGSFRGFGGLFAEPPLVVAAGEHFLARSNSECWLLTADLFGATFHRAAIEEFETATQHSQLPASLEIDGSRVALNGDGCELPAIGDVTSVAANGTTLAFTARLTHSIVLVALQ